MPLFSRLNISRLEGLLFEKRRDSSVYGCVFADIEGLSALLPPHASGVPIDDV
jgi:hypothetical protein